MYITAPIVTYLPIRLKKVQYPQNVHYLTDLEKDSNEMFSYNSTHIEIKTKQGTTFKIGYKTLEANPTPRNYAHLTRYGTQSERSFSINSGKYALGNNPST